MKYAPCRTLVVGLLAGLVIQPASADDAPEQKEIRVSTMLPGGRSVVERMRVGDRWNVAIPPDQAFGIGGRTPDIGPNETLLIDVTLLEIK